MGYGRRQETPIRRRTDELSIFGLVGEKTTTFSLGSLIVVILKRAIIGAAPR